MVDSFIRYGLRSRVTPPIDVVNLIWRNGRGHHLAGDAPASAGAACLPPRVAGPPPRCHAGACDADWRQNQAGPCSGRCSRAPRHLGSGRAHSVRGGLPVSRRPDHASPRGETLGPACGPQPHEVTMVETTMPTGGPATRDNAGHVPPQQRAGRDPEIARRR